MDDNIIIMLYLRTPKGYLRALDNSSVYINKGNHCETKRYYYIVMFTIDA